MSEDTGRCQQVALVDIGEVRYGPTFSELRIDGKAVAGKIFGTELAWSDDGRLIAVQEWLTTDYASGPKTRAMIINLVSQRYSCLETIDKGWAVAFRFEGANFRYEHFFAAEDRRAATGVALADLDVWQPLVWKKAPAKIKRLQAADTLPATWESIREEGIPDQPGRRMIPLLLGIAVMMTILAAGLLGINEFMAFDEDALNQQVWSRAWPVALGACYFLALVFFYIRRDLPLALRWSGGLLLPPLAALLLTISLGQFVLLAVNGWSGAQREVEIRGRVVDLSTGEGRSLISHFAVVASESAPHDWRFRLPLQEYRNLSIGQPYRVRWTEGSLGILYRRL